MPWSKNNPYYRLLAILLLIITIASPLLVLTTYADVGVQPIKPVPINQPREEPKAPTNPSQPVVQPTPGNGHHKVIVYRPTPKPVKVKESHHKVKAKPPSTGVKIVKNLKHLIKHVNGKLIKEYGVVTLITGDVVQFAKINGTYFVSVKPTNYHKKFFTLAAKGRLYVIPYGVNLKKFGMELFDVTYLAKYYSKLSYLPLIIKVASKPNVSPKQVLESYMKSVKGVKGYSFSIIKAFRMTVPYKEIGKVYSMLAKDPRVVKVVLDKIIRVAKLPLNAGHVIAPALYKSAKLVGAVYARKLGINGTGIRVAVLDTGIDTTHPDFYFPNGTSKIVASKSFVPGENITDYFGHGTHVAGIIAGTGRASNGTIVGIAPGALLVIGKVLCNAGWGYESWIINGIQWAIEENASIISMSLGGTPILGYDPLEAAVINATEQGVVVVIAAGNDGPAYFTVDSPGLTSAAITVAAVNDNLEPPWWSSVGPSIKLTAKPDIAAPGVMITSARAKGTYMGYPASDYYQIASGTSMATPHVSGLVALLIQGIRYREKLLNQTIPMTPMNLKYMLMDYSQPLPWDPTQVGVGFANITTLIGALVNPNDTVAYIVPSNETLKGFGGVATYSFKLVVIPGESLLNKTLMLNITSYVYPWLSATIPFTAVNITPSFLNLTIKNTSVITETINVTVNWTSMDAGFHYLYIYLKPVNATSVPMPSYYGMRTMVGLFKLQRMFVNIKSSTPIEGILAVIPELYYGPGYLPVLFDVSGTYNVTEVPVVVPGVDYVVMLGAVAPSMDEIITTTAYDVDTYTYPYMTTFNYTIDIDDQLNSYFLQRLGIRPPSYMALPEPFFVADEENVNGYMMAVYSFGNSVTVVAPYYKSWFVDDSEFEVYPTLIVMWPLSNGTIRAYLSQMYLPSYGSEIFITQPNYHAQAILRKIGSETVYIPIGLIPEYNDYISISPQYGFLTPKVVDVGIYANEYSDLYAFYTPAYMYVTDNQGHRIGLIQFNSTFLTYSFFNMNNQAYTDPLRMPYGTTVWYMDLTAWKGIDGNDYLCGEEYIRLLDSWWNTYGVISAYTILTINGKEVLVSVDDDPGVYTFGWANIGKTPNATLTLTTYGGLSWANNYGDYVNFLSNIMGELSFKLNGLPTNITSGVPPIMFMDLGWYRIPGYGVPLISVSPLTLDNTVPSNITKVANMTVLIHTPIQWGLSGTLSTPYVEVYITNASGYPLELVYSGKPEEIEEFPGWYILTGTFDPTKLPPGYYGIKVITSANYTTVEELTGHNVTVTITFAYSTYPAIKTAPLVIKPYYVGPQPWCNFTSISEAVKHAYPNQTIYVMPGVYNEGNIIIDKPLKIIGVVINGSEPIINITGYYYAFKVMRTDDVLISNFTIVNSANSPFCNGIEALLTKRLTISNINLQLTNAYNGIIVGTVDNLTITNVKSTSKSRMIDGIAIFETNNLVLENVHLNSAPGYEGFEGLILHGLTGNVVLKNIYIDYYYSAPIDMKVVAWMTKLAYSNIYVNNSGVMEPVTIYLYYNTSLTITPSTKYVVIDASMSNITVSNSRLSYLDVNVDYTNLTLSGLTFINRTCRTFNIINVFGGNLAINNVINLQPLASGLYTNESETYLILDGLTNTEIVNSTLSQVWAWGNYSINASNCYFYSTPGHYGLIVDFYVNNVSVTNSTFISVGSSENKGTVGLLINMPANSVIVIGNKFENFIYGVVAYSPYDIYSQRLAIKDNLYVGVSVPVTLLPPGTVPSWLEEFYNFGIPPSKALWYITNQNSQNPFYSKSTNSQSFSPPEISVKLNYTVSHVLICSNTFINYSIGINASIPLNASLVIINNTFTSSNSKYDIMIYSANFTGVWLNTFSNNSNLIINSSNTYINYNNFLGREVEARLIGSYADVRFNYFAGSHNLIAYNGLKLNAGSTYVTPLSLPIRGLVPIIEFPNTSLVVAGTTRQLTFKFINPYFSNVSFNYTISSAPGISVSKVEGSSSLTPAYMNASFGEVGVNVTGMSPGTSAVYVDVNGFKYPYPIKVLPATIGLSINVSKSVLRGSTVPVTIIINSKVNASLKGELVISLANGLEIKDPDIYRYATAAVIPLNISEGVNIVNINLTALYVGNASITASLYVDNLAEAVNSTKVTLSIMPNPYVKFSITSVQYSNVTAGEYSYIEIELKGDAIYTQVINVTLTSSNLSVLGLGYGGSDKYFTSVVRTDPYARIAYVYVPIKGINPGTSAVTINAVSVGDNVSVTRTVTIYVKPKLSWAYVSNTTMVSNNYNESSMEIKYPNTTLKAKLWLSIYASKVSASYKALGRLMSVPWGCVEQTTSPLLADIELYTYISRNNLWSKLTSIINRSVLEDYIRYGVQRLLYYHLSCNSSMCWFAWYPGMSPAKFFTIYGTLGLLRAVEFAYVKYPGWTNSTFNLNVNVTYLNESIEKLLTGIIRLRNAEGYWSYPPGAMDYITDEVPLTSLAVYVLSEALNLGYLPYGYNSTEVINIISQAVNWLEAQQLSDGGWKPNAEATQSCPYATGYVLAALAEASKAGVQVNLSVIEKAINYLNSTAKGTESVKFWVPSTQWLSWWGIDDYVTTAQIVLSLADILSSPINNSLTQTYSSLALNLSHAGALFLVSVANEWLTAADTCEDSTILRALNSVNVDLTFSKPLVINVKIIGNGTQVLFNKDYSLATAYNYTYEEFNLNNLGWLSQFKDYVITVKLVSGSGQAIVTAYSIYGYLPTTSTSGATSKNLRLESASRKVTLVLGGKKYVVEQESSKSTNVGLEVGLKVSNTYVVKGGKVFATITLKGVGANLFAVVVTEKALPGFKIVINKTLLGSNVAFDEDRYNKSGGRIIESNSTSIVAVGGTLAFAVQSVSTEGTSITYELIPVNVSTGKVTLPPVKAWMFYTPIGKNITGETTTQPTITIGLPMAVRMVSEVISKGQEIGDNNALHWGDKVCIDINVPTGVNVTVKAILEGSNVTYTLSEEGVSGGYVKLLLDTLKLVKNASKLEGTYVTLKIQVLANGTILAQKSYRLYMTKISRLDLFKRMVNVELEYATSSPIQRQSIINNEVNPLKTLWGEG